VIVNLFSGIGGWADALRDRQLPEVGIDWDRWVCATRRCAGHQATERDVTDTHPDAAPSIDGLIATPPRRRPTNLGLRWTADAHTVLATAVAWTIRGQDRRADARAALDELLDHHLDRALAANIARRASTVIDPARWIDHHRPTWVVLDLPPAMAVWEAYIDGLTSIGYQVAHGPISDADWGLSPRLRSIVVAHRDHTPTLPNRTPPAPRAPRGEGIAGLLALRGFPTDYPLQGPEDAQARQVAGAIPPAIAAAILEGVLG